MSKLSRFALTLAALTGGALLAEAPPASAKGIAQAFAVVQAAEATVETCHAETARAAQSCALAKCRRKAGRGACFAVTACAPSGWAGVMGIKLKEAHFSETVCGAPTREAALAALKAFCRGHLPNLQQCYVFQLWGPNGKAEKINLTWDPPALSQHSTP